jgi:hypothetical protein
MNNITLTVEQHIQYHIQLHRNLDELIADFIDKTGKLPNRTYLAELMIWSFRQTVNPDTESLPIEQWMREAGADDLSPDDYFSSPVSSILEKAGEAHPQLEGIAKYLITQERSETVRFCANLAIAAGNSPSHLMYLLGRLTYFLTREEGVNQRPQT